MLEPVYIPNFIDPESSEEFYRTLMNDLDWVHREGAPRKEYWATTKGKSYTYGQGRGIRTYEPQPTHTVVDTVREMLVLRNIEFGWTGFYEGCFLNRYDDGRDQLGWHADDDPGIDHANPIAVVTLGNARIIQWKEIGSKGIESINEQLLEPGSAFFMPPGMQDEFYHRIPKAVSPPPKGPRISMTYRCLK